MDEQGASRARRALAVLAVFTLMAGDFWRNLLGWWGMGVGVAFIALSFLIKGWAHGADDTTAPVEPEPSVSPAAIRADREG